MALRGRLGLPPGERGDSRAETAASTLALTAQQLRAFVRLCAKRYDSKRMDPGTAHALSSVFVTACLSSCRTSTSCQLRLRGCEISQSIPEESPTQARHDMADT